MEQIISIVILCFILVEILLANKLCKDLASQSEKIYIPILIKVETYFRYGIVAKDLAFDDLPYDKQKQITVSIMVDNARYGHNDLDPMIRVRYYKSVWNHMKKTS